MVNVEVYFLSEMLNERLKTVLIVVSTGEGGAGVAPVDVMDPGVKGHLLTMAPTVTPDRGQYR